MEGQCQCLLFGWGVGRQGRERPRTGCPHPTFDQSWFQRFLAPHLPEVMPAAALGARKRQERGERGS